MCGIYGVVQLDGKSANPDCLTAMAANIVHRGPDDSGTYVNGPAAIGMRRLSIIDVDGGHQPIPNEDHNVWCVCNGEIYNFRVLREELERAGHRFSTHSDSEVALHLYEQ